MVSELTGQYQSVESILLKCPEAVHSTDAMLFRPLHWAAVYNRLEMAQLFLRCGADVNVLDDQGRTPLHRAVQFENLDLVVLLIQNGAAMEAQDEFGWTPIFHAVTCGMLEILKCLVSLGANVHVRDSNGQTPLHFAAHRTAQEHLITVSMCSVDFPMRHLRTAGPTLHKAVFKDPSIDVALVNVLLDAGARVNTKDGLGRTPFKIAAVEGQFYIARLLYEAGADLSLETAWISGVEWPYKVAENAEFCEWLLDKFETRVRSLLDLCKVALRRSLVSGINEKIYSLCLPHTIKQFCTLQSN